MEQRTGKFIPSADVSARQAQGEPVTQLTNEEHETLAQLSEGSRPVALAWMRYFSTKKRWSRVSQRESFNAGYEAALRDNGLLKEEKNESKT